MKLAPRRILLVLQRRKRGLELYARSHTAGELQNCRSGRQSSDPPALKVQVLVPALLKCSLPFDLNTSRNRNPNNEPVFLFFLTRCLSFFMRTHSLHLLPSPCPDLLSAPPTELRTDCFCRKRGTLLGVGRAYC